MSVSDLDQMFDLDMALTTPSTTTLEDSISGGDDHRNTMKLSESNASIHNHRLELPTVTATGICTVCMDAFQSGVGSTGKQVPCGHVFHSNCIEEWLSVQNSCPLCRFSVLLSIGQGSSTTSS